MCTELTKQKPRCWHAKLPLCFWQKGKTHWGTAAHFTHTYTLTRRHVHAYVSLQPLISQAAGPSFRITLLSSQPQEAKLFKYSNSSLLPPTHPLSLSSTLPLIICLFIVANLEAIPPINDANCSKWCRSWVNAGEGGGGGGRCQREGSSARVARTMLGILQAAVQI